MQYGIHGGLGALGIGSAPAAAAINLQLTDDLLDRLGGIEGLKALNAGDGTGTTGINAQGFVPEDLDLQAHLSLWRDDNIKFAREVPRIGGESQIHEFEYVDEYGDLWASPFQPESGLGPQTNYTGRRRTTRIVTFSHTNKVSGMAQAQRTVRVLGANKAFDSNRKAIMLVHLFKKAMYMVYGDSSASSSNLRWSGLIQQFRERNSAAAFAGNYGSVDPTLIIDKQGARMSRVDVELSSVDMFTQSWGRMNRLYFDSEVSQHFQGEVEGNYAGQTPFQIERTGLTDGQPGGVFVGQPIAGVVAQGSRVHFNVDNTLHPRHFFAEPYDEAIRKGRVYTPPSGAPAKAPTPALQVGANVANSRWLAADIPAAPSIKYKVQACNDEGFGPPSDATGNSTVAAAGSNILTWNGAADAKSYRILRNDPTSDDPTRYWMIAEIQNSQPGGGQISYTDLNWWLPGSHVVIGIEMLAPATANNMLGANAEENALRWVELEKFHTMPLAKIGDFYWELLLERCTPELVQHTRVRLWINVGSR